MNFSALLNSRCPHRPRPAVLGVAIAMLSVSALASNPIAPPDRKRVEAAVSAARSTTGLELVSKNSMGNRRGRTIVRVTQAYQGRRVWGSEAVLHSDRGGSARIASSALATRPVPAGTATISQERAIEIARRAIALKGASFPPKAELVVFPTAYHGSVKLAWDARKHDYVVDHRLTVVAVPPTDPYVWAWEVQVVARNRVDGVQDMKYVVDARTGAIMHVESGKKALAPDNPPIQVGTDTPAIGLGHSQWSGDVPLSTTQHADGTFALLDMTRGSAPNPFLYQNVLDANGNPVVAIGLQTIAETHEGDIDDGTWTSGNFWFDGNPTNTWGDGQQFVMYPYGGETSVNGQTAAVDAHWGMAQVWDFYRNVFGRNGIDNLGSSAWSEVHIVDSNSGSYYYYDNAYWDDFLFGMSYSDGSLNVGVDPNTGGPTTPYPNGDNSLTELDIIGHEMTHGVTANSDGLDYDGESGALNESTSDFMGSMVEAYATRVPGQDAYIPNTGTDWLMGAQIASAPLRTMIHPSLDGASVDSWYSGIDYLDVHFSSGAMNRCFYFMAQGSSADPKSDSYSAYLPGGMTGIGNDAAAWIWYAAMTEWLTPHAKFKEARAAAVNAAIEYYGDGSREVIGVRNAFAAINVGTPTDAPRITIQFPLVHPPGSGALNQSIYAAFQARMPVVALGTPVKLSAQVDNAADTSVTWHIGGMPGSYNSKGSFRNVGGTIDADGSWTPAGVAGYQAMTVSSNADPLEFAQGIVQVVDADADADTEFDAIDLGGVALSWALDDWVQASHGLGVLGYVDDTSVQMIDEAFKNAFGGI